MEETDRARITHNLVELINQANLDSILPHLLQKRVFREGMMERYRDARISLSERKREMFLELQHRGPEAFNHLVETLLDTGHLDLVKLLNPNLDIEQHFREEEFRQNGLFRPYPGNVTIELRPPSSVVSLGTTPLRVQVTKGTRRMDIPAADGPPVYPMGSRPRGFFLMINNVEFTNNIERTRTGSEVDERNLRDLFEQLGFIVESYRDQGLEDMKRKITQFASSPRHSSCDCCVVAIMSHGRQGSSRMDSSIVTVEGKTLSIEWVLNQFSALSARALVKKPKIFFFQSCRGNEEDFGVHMLTGRVQPDGHPSVLVHSMSDMLIGYSTLPGFKSNRDVHLGTWYIQAVCEVFMKYAHCMDIEDMLKKVTYQIQSLQTERGTLQTSAYENRGFHKLYFNPGLYNEDTSVA